MFTRILTTKEKNIKRYSVSALFWKIVPIQILACSIGALNSLIDTFIGSKFLGAAEMAAVGLFSPLATFTGGFVAVCSTGAVISIISRFGKNDVESARRIFTWALIIVSIFSILISTILLVFTNPIAVFLKGNKGNTYLSDYMKGITIFTIFQLISGILMDSLQVASNKKHYSYISIIAMAITNVTCDILFVVVFKMGIFGLGLATGLGYFVQFIVMLIPYLNKNYPLKLCFKPLKKSELSKIVTDGLPTAFSSLSLSIKSFVVNGVLVAYGGTAAMAALAVQNTFCWFMGAITTGISQATLMLMALFISEDDRESIKQLLVLMLKSALLIGLTNAGILIALAEPLSNVFYPNNKEVLDITINAFRIFPIFLPFNIICASFTKAYQSQGKKIYTYTLAILENVFVATFTVLLSYFMGVNGVWAALPIALFSLLITMLLITFIHNKKISFNIYDILMLKDTVGVNANNRLSKTILSLNQAINLSISVSDFCKSHNLPNRISYLSGLSVEEICVLLLNRNLPNKKRFRLELRLIYKEDKLIIRIRDNGNNIFVGKKLELPNSSDPAANVGIKMISDLVSESSTNSFMGLNVITMIINIPEIKTA